MSSATDRTSVAPSPVEAGPGIPLLPFGLSLSTFLAVTFVLCTVADVVPWLQDVHVLKVLYPDIDWVRPEMIAIGTIWAFLTGWYVALGFGSLYNFFVARTR